MGEPKREDKDKDTGQGTSHDERGLFECHAEDGEDCSGAPVKEKKPDALHPTIKKVEAVHGAERPKDERALFDCDENGEKCDA